MKSLTLQGILEYAEHKARQIHDDAETLYKQGKFVESVEQDARSHIYEEMALKLRMVIA